MCLCVCVYVCVRARAFALGLVFGGSETEVVCGCTEKVWELVL